MKDDHSKDIDLFLFCLKMMERLDHYHICQVKAITNTLTMDVWKKVYSLLPIRLNGECFTSGKTK